MRLVLRAPRRQRCVRTAGRSLGVVVVLIAATEAGSRPRGAGQYDLLASRDLVRFDLGLRGLVVVGVLVGVLGLFVGLVRLVTAVRLRVDLGGDGLARGERRRVLTADERRHDARGDRRQIDVQGRVLSG